MKRNTEENEMGPVAKARAIFDLAKNKPRREVIDLAVNVGGVKRSTASTQYQVWKNEHQR